MIRQIAAADLDKHWIDIHPMLERAITNTKCNDYTIADTYDLIRAGRWRLYVAEENGAIHGAAAVSFQQYPHDIVAYITVIGGKFISSKTISRTFFDMLKAAGAHRVQGACSPAIARLWRRIGLLPKYEIVEGIL